MKRIKNLIAVLICLVLLINVFAGCSGKNDPIDFIYPFDAQITSFDPQIAATSDEYLIIENCFEGLVRVLDDGAVQDAVAESWDISDDGLTYTFKLHKGIKWRVQSADQNNPTHAQDLMGLDFNPDVTANDFVFALKRAVDPVTDSPLFSSVAGIVNASDIHSGKKNVNELGAKALDDYTLEIKLESADNGFLNTLSTAVAMPCNEEYFYATKGRYGLGLDYTIFNGQFYVSSILETSYILKNNSDYTGPHKSAVSDITLRIKDDETDVVKNLKNGYFDSAYITGSQYEQLKNENITVLPYSDKMWAFIINKNKQLFSNKNLRRAVCLSISNDEDTGHIYLTKATTFTPPSCIIGDKNANEAIGTTIPVQNTQDAIAAWKKGLEETDFTVADITVIVPQEMEDIAKNLVQGIQGGIGKITNYGDENKISFSLKINSLPAEEYKESLNKGEYDIALYQFTANNHNTVSFLQDIINGNFAGDIEQIQQTIENAQNANAADMPSACKECEETLMNDYSIMPLFYESSYYAQAKGVKGVQFHAGSGRVCFVNATREN